MSDFALGGYSVVAHDGVDTANSRGTSVTPGTSHAKGSWTQLVASSSAMADAIMVYLKFTQFDMYLVDIGIGAAGSELVIVPNIQSVTWNNTHRALACFLPVSIPQGTRIAARAQTDVGSATVVFASIQLLKGGFNQPSPYSKVADFGAVTASTRGTAVTSGAANTKGGYVEFSASLPDDIKGLGFNVGRATDAGTDDDQLWDIAIGAAGSEQVVVPNIYIRRTDNEIVYPSQFMYFPVNLPKGQRLSVRFQSITAADVGHVILHGVS